MLTDLWFFASAGGRWKALSGRPAGGRPAVSAKAAEAKIKFNFYDSKKVFWEICLIESVIYYIFKVYMLSISYHDLFWALKAKPAILQNGRRPNSWKRENEQKTKLLKM